MTRDSNCWVEEMEENSTGVPTSPDGRTRRLDLTESQQDSTLEPVVMENTGRLQYIKSSTKVRKNSSTRVRRTAPPG